MPMQYVEPEVAFQVIDPENMAWIIYHVYNNNMMDERRTFWYTTCSKDVWRSHESEANEFDIRSLFFAPYHLDKELTPMQRAGDNSHRLVLQMALDRGLVAFNGNRELVFNQAHVRSHA